MNRIIILILSLMVSISLSAEYSQTNSRNIKWGTKVKDTPLNNMYQIDKGIYRSEQPKKREFPLLESYGIDEVLNLRNYHDNKDEAEGTGIILYQVKLAAHRIKKKSVIEALKIIKERKGDILIHCHHGSDRTGLIVAMYRIVFQDWTKEEAIDEMRNGDYGYHKIYSNITRFINNADIEEFRKELGLSE